MFTGLVEHMGTIVGIGKKENSFLLTIDSQFDLTPSDIGASIAVEGVCLTVVKIEGKRFTVDVSPETLSRSTLEERKHGDSVNLERALRLSDRLGGHLVSGHIDGSGMVKDINREENAIIYTFSTSPAISRYIVVKGSVALDGISLTVNDVQDNDFSVSIIFSNLVSLSISRGSISTLIAPFPSNTHLSLIVLSSFAYFEPIFAILIAFLAALKIDSSSVLTIEVKPQALSIRALADTPPVV